MDILSFKTSDEFRSWLEGKHLGTSGVWLQLYKKGSSTPSITYAEALEQALCYGWIDDRIGASCCKAAKTDGRWQAAYSSQRNASPPADLLAELQKNKKAKASFETLNKANVYAIVYRLQTAKKPETRVRRLKIILEMLEKGEKFHESK